MQAENRSVLQIESSMQLIVVGVISTLVCATVPDSDRAFVAETYAERTVIRKVF